MCHVYFSGDTIHLVPAELPSGIFKRTGRRACIVIRTLFLVSLISLGGAIAFGEDESPADKAINKAIADLDKAKLTLKDPLDQAKIDKAIRELEIIIGDEDATKGAPLNFVVKPADLKKKFGGKATFNAKTGELTLAYDFGQKSQLSDFEVADLKVLLKDKTLYIDSADKLQHSARFRSFTVSAVMAIKVMRGPGIASSNGTLLGTGGLNADSVWVQAIDGAGAGKVVPDNIRSGRIPVTFTITPVKSSISYGNERLATPTVKKDDIHQIVLVGGTEGCGFSNLVITGVPDPAWFKEHLGAE